MSAYLNFIGRVVNIQLSVLDIRAAGNQTTESGEALETVSTTVDFIIDIVNLALQFIEDSKNKKS